MKASLKTKDRSARAKEVSRPQGQAVTSDWLILNWADKAGFSTRLFSNGLTPWRRESLSPTSEIISEKPKPTRP